MQTPDTGAPGAKPTPASMPVEKLIQSMQPEQPLNIDSTTGGGATSTGTSTGTTATTQ
jgi:hypothetical protein